MGTPDTAGPLRSYKLRTSRITPGQRRALSDLLPVWGIPTSARPIDVEEIFGRRAGLVLEIGFGMGESTLAMAAADPDRDVIGVEVHTPGVGALLRDAEAAGLKNIRVVVADARLVLREMLAADSLDEIRVFFPDPWPKSRHHKRRLVTPPFARLAAGRLRPGGRLHLATDWAEYARVMLSIVEAEPLLRNRFESFADPGTHRPTTRFERSGLAKGHHIREVVAERVTR